MSELALIAWAKATEAVANMVTEIVRGQPDPVKIQAWTWWMEDQKRWRRFFKLDKLEMEDEVKDEKK